MAESTAEESAHRGTLATDARGFSPRSGRRLLQPRGLRRVSGRGVRGVPAVAARARAQARPSSSLGASTGRCTRPVASLAEFVGAHADDLVFSPNATSALNAVIRSLRIRPEEEILTTKHEYGAIVRTLGFIRANVVLVEPEELIANIGIRTRAIVVSHITSPTALVLPVEEICDAARKAGVLSIVDGAHVPGHIPLDLGVARRRRVCGQLPQVAVRAEGRGVPVGTARASGLDRAARDQLGLPRGGRLRRATRLAGDARSRCLSCCAEGDRGARLVRSRRGEGPRRRGGAPTVALRGEAHPWRALAAHARAHRAAWRPGGSPAPALRGAPRRDPGLRVGGHLAHARLDRPLQRRVRRRAAGRRGQGHSRRR